MILPGCSLEPFIPLPGCKFGSQKDRLDSEGDKRGKVKSNTGRATKAWEVTIGKITNPMQRPLIFLATDDPSFEAIATDAILESGHGLRRAHGIREAFHCLSQGATDVALAVIDLDFPGGLSLLRILGGCEPDFPILAVTNDRRLFWDDETLSEMAFAHLLKPVSPSEFRGKISELCRTRDVAGENGKPCGTGCGKPTACGDLKCLVSQPGGMTSVAMLTT